MQDYNDYKPNLTVSSKSIITEAEVIAAQKDWGDGLVRISKTYEEKGYDEAKKVAQSVLDTSYGYAKGFPVLFKPTLTSGKQTFRLSNDGALAYFVGGVEGFPDVLGKGFAMKGWREVNSYPAGIQLLGNTALSMGNVHCIDKNGKATIVDKTWGYTKDDEGKVRIILHHSSLPYEAKEEPSTIVHEWGLEKLGDFDVTLPDGQPRPTDEATRPKTVLIGAPNPAGTEYYIPLTVPEILIRFDLKSVNVIQGFLIQVHYYTQLDDVQVGVHFDDKYAGQTLQFPNMTSDGWKWFNGKPLLECNGKQTIVIPKVAARYVIARVKVRRGPTNWKHWGLLRTLISKPKAS